MKKIICATCFTLITITQPAQSQTSGLECHFDQIKSTYPSSDFAEGVAVANGYLFVADRFSGLQIFDSTPPFSPTIIGASTASGGFLNIEFSGDNVIVGTETAGLRRIRVLDPTSPILAGRVPLNKPCWDIATQGDITYVANLADGVKIISTPQTGAMSILSTYNPAPWVFSIAIDGNIAVVGLDTGVQILDVSDPSAPQLVSTVPGINERVSDVVYANGIAYIAGHQLYVVDLSNPTLPVIINSIDTGVPINLFIDDSRLYARSVGGGVPLTDVFDISTPTDPQLIGTVTVPTTENRFAVSSGLMYSANGASGVIVASVDPLLSTPVIGNEPLPGLYSAPVAASPDGALGFFRAPASSFHGLNEMLYIFDLHAPTGTPIIGQLDLGTNGIGSADIQTGNGVVYLGGGIPSLTIVDVSDPTNPTLLGDSGFYSSTTRQLLVQGSFVYTYAESSLGIDIYDCSDPTAPLYLGNRIPTGPGSISGLAKLGPDNLIVGRTHFGVQVLDTSVPGVLPVIGSLGGFRAGKIVARGNRAYSLVGGLKVIDLSNVQNPVIIGDLPIPGEIMAIPSDGRLVINAEFGSVMFYDITDPTAITSIGEFSVQTQEFCAADEGTMLFSSFGMHVIDISSSFLCTADLTGDGLLNFFDISTFLAAFAAQDQIADFTNDGQFNFFDVSAFLAAFAAGCP